MTCTRCGEEALTRKDGTPRDPMQHKWGPRLHQFANPGGQTVSAWVRRAQSATLPVKEYAR